ncbi:MAG: response regulator [Sphingomicrobium sp.]
MNAQPRLLLIDDEPALGDFLATVAQGCGFHPVLTSEDGKFRDEFRAERPDLVALDLGMPGMDGVELLRFLAAEHFQGPVLIVSGFDRRVLDSAFRLGQAIGLQMVGPLAKPARLEEVEVVLNNLKELLDQ